jgi:carboxylate-amine ligase
VSAIDPAFGSRPAFWVGIEEELLLVDAESHQLAAVSAEVLAAVEAPADAAVHEAYAAEVELRSAPSREAGSAAAELESLRRAVRRAGGTPMGAGVHPDGDFGDAPLVAAERYRAVAEQMRGLLARTPECALHVHVAMPDADTAIRVHNALRAWLPLLQGVAANSPYWFGQESGLASTRASLVRSYPRAGVPPAFRDYDDYTTTVAAILAAGDLPDYSYLWWDVRPHPRLGSVELRTMDAQSSLDTVAGVSALAQALAKRAGEAGFADPVPPREALAESSFRASRDGIDALLHDGERLRPLREIARGALAAARPHARELGGEDALDGVERVLRDGGGAARQRAAHRRGGMPELLETLVRETTAPLRG